LDFNPSFTTIKTTIFEFPTLLRFPQAQMLPNDRKFLFPFT